MLIQTIYGVMVATLQGVYKPENKHKYSGKVPQIVYRSSWELAYMRVLDLDPNVVAWSSEEIIIPYRDPKTGNIRRYFMDFYVKRKKNDGFAEQIIEIKPLSQTKRPVINGTKKKKKTIINEVLTYETNQAKWAAAEIFAKKRGWEFKILTEQELFGYK